MVWGGLVFGLVWFGVWFSLSVCQFVCLFVCLFVFFFISSFVRAFVHSFVKLHYWDRGRPEFTPTSFFLVATFESWCHTLMILACRPKA